MKQLHLALFPRLLFRIFATWQVSWLSPKSLPSRYIQWLFLTFHNGDDSSGYCSGFAPDSLYTWVEHPVSPMSDAKLIIYGGKAKKVVLIFKSVTNKQRFLPICRKCGCLSLIVLGKKTKNHCSSSDPSYLCRRNNKNRPALTKQKKIITIKKIRL